MSLDQSPPANEAAAQAIAALGQILDSIETEREANLGDGMPDEDATLFAELCTSRALSAFCQDQGIESRSINRLVIDLANIAIRGKPSDVFAYRGGRGTPRDDIMVEEVKGRLAAIAVCYQRKGHSRAEATQWVANHLVELRHKAFKRAKASTVDEWIERWGGEYGEPGRGRDCYLNMLEHLGERPDEATLLRLIRRLPRYLLPRR